ncbi:MAG TPA: glutamyl-tRNA reductase [Epsilonproteobacteria bacterium]|nr:glutamyl-tRNA reductase [Campylobacterota bacterium]
MYYQVISFNYKTCDLASRERLALKAKGDQEALLQRLVSFDFIHEAFMLNTCNRVEIITANKDNFATYHTILGVMSEYSGVNFYQLKEMMQRVDDEDAIFHIFSVVSSLDSLVIGESQITGQVKEAFKYAYEHGTAGKRLNRVVSYAIKCAAQVRNATLISENPISIASVAVAQAEEILQDTMAGMTAVVIGAGEMGTLAVKHLLRSGCDVILLGRDLIKAEQAASALGENVKVDSFENLAKYINRYRLVFSATSSPQSVLKKEMVQECDFKRLWFDMAIPRDIDEIYDEKITIYRIDDLQHISNANHALRQEQALKATEIVEKFKEEFFRWLRALSIEPVIKGVREHANLAIEKELKRAIKKGFVPATLEDNLRKMAVQMFNHFLHNPTKKMRQSSHEKEGLSKIEAIEAIFEVNTENVDPKQYKDKHHQKGYSA